MTRLSDPCSSHDVFLRRGGQAKLAHLYKREEGLYSSESPEDINVEDTLEVGQFSANMDNNETAA